MSCYLCWVVCMCLFIVEDNVDIVVNFYFYLELLGYQFDCEYNGYVGLNVVVYGKYDVIVLDLMLLGFSGLELC